MKSSCRRLIAFGFILSTSSCAIFAQPFSMDENGNGFTYAGIVTGSPLTYRFAPDPTGGVSTSPVLIYSLGEPVESGDLALVGPDGSTVDALLRFFTTPGAGTSDMIFYTPADGSVAGVGIPSLEIPETGSQTFFRPSGNQPGQGVGVFPAFDVFQYTFITSPEPCTTGLLLVGAGVGLMGGSLRRKR